MEGLDSTVPVDLYPIVANAAKGAVYYRRDAGSDQKLGRIGTLSLVT